MNKYYFKKFDFRAFKDFIYELVDKYRFFEIRFYPDRREFFSEFQLTHAAPLRNINHPDSFIGAWKKKQKEVRKVSLDFWRKDQTAKISMTVDLDRKFISFDKIEGNISLIQLEEVLSENLEINERMQRFKILNFLKEHLIKIIITIIAGLIIAYLTCKFGWK